MIASIYRAAPPHALQVRRILSAVVSTIMWFSTPAQAQALRPLSPGFVEVLNETDAAVAQVAGTLKRFLGEDIRFGSPSRQQLDDTIGRLEKSLAQAQMQSADLRRRESLLALLALNTSVGAVQQNLAAAASMLHGATVRSPAALDTLNGVLAGLDKNAERLNAATVKFNNSAQLLLERLDRVPLPAEK